MEEGITQALPGDKPSLGYLERWVAGDVGETALCCVNTFIGGRCFVAFWGPFSERCGRS